MLRHKSVAPHGAPWHRDLGEDELNVLRGVRKLNSNLPMLLALDGLRSEFKNVADLAPAIAKKGRHAVVDASGTLKRHRHEFGTGEIPAIEP